MDIQKKEVLIAEIEKFKEEALKMHIVQVLADTYTNTSLFDFNIDSDGSVIWYRDQARQLWDFWQTSKTQVPEGFVFVPKVPLYLVWNKGKSECVGFMNKGDAKYASTGVSYSCSVSTTAESFREVYEDEADEQDFIITEVMIEAQESGHDK